MKIIISFISFLLLFPTVLQAQQDDEITGGITIWNNPSIFANRGYVVYPFMADTLGINIPGGESLTNFTITTNCGDLNFDGDITGSEGGRYLEGSIVTDLACDKIIIVRATAKMGSMTVDLTNILSISDSKPEPLEFMNSPTQTNTQTSNQPTAQTTEPTAETCENKTLGSGTGKGTYLGMDCGDYCHIYVKLDSGEETSYLAGGNTQSFKGSKGSHVSFSFDQVQFFEAFEGTDCLQAEEMTSIVLIK
jgi:hypothetical protein